MVSAAICSVLKPCSRAVLRKATCAVVKLARSVPTAFSWLVDNYPRLADWNACARRIASLMMSLDGLERAERGDGITQFSLRGDGSVDVSAIAKSFGGGGHHNSAGCRIAHTESDKKKLLAALEELLG